MSRLVLVHGIGQQVKGPQTVLGEWYPALCDGLILAHGAARLGQDEIAVGFYGDIFRLRGGRGLDSPLLDASDVTAPENQQLLRAWWEEAARTETVVHGPDDLGRVRTPNWIQRALDALSHSAFFAGLSEHALVSSLSQVRRYFTEPATRQAIRDRVAACVTSETCVIAAHSLGSVAAYEAMCAHPEWSGISLVTLGSPLGIRNLVFDRLEPVPAQGKGHWPQCASSWTNIADSGDIVALAKTLAPLFAGPVTDMLVHNGAQAHDVRPYLTARETGVAIASGLARLAADGEREDMQGRTADADSISRSRQAAALVPRTRSRVLSFAHVVSQ
jgi:hypothetical protein